ncbi:WD40/YVTN/BNR-like repeat-containing protein [Edaphobacter albus]|uniref:WD40/YVTN/BNR-like repeat-containing protein n=1 Tax=Edaphobacter sp. 4G125 TaxID=2763071 RepID=UPI001644CCE3|nr:hypothetical protein [Edaphobacter sp. 4G125]QNI36770.1 hypothetical protein H7846_17855 [Edaphobacter sp. 4G125]
MRSIFFIAVLALSASANAQFQIQDSHTTASLRGIHSLGDGVAWASGTEGTILRTIDDGATWQHCSIPSGAEKLDFRGVQAFDPDTAIAMSSGKGDLSRLYKTTDGCKTWKLVFTNPDKDGFWDSIDLSSNGAYWSKDSRYVAGVVLGDPVNGFFSIFATQDGGETWHRRVISKTRTKDFDCKTDPFPSQENESAFAASNQSLLYYNYYSFLFVTGGSHARLGYLDHFDLDFSFCHDYAKFIELPLAQGSDAAGAFAVATKQFPISSPFQLMIVGGNYKRPDDPNGTAVFLSYRDGFKLPLTPDFDVVKPQTPPHGYRSSVAYDASTKTWITVGPNGTDISRDDGKNWQALKPSPTDAPDADKNWNALSLPFVVGPKGRIGKLRPDALKPTK